MSEEIKAKIDAERAKLAKLARMQIKAKLKHMGLVKQSDEADEEPVPKTRKGKAKDKDN